MTDFVVKLPRVENNQSSGAITTELTVVHSKAIVILWCAATNGMSHNVEQANKKTDIMLNNCGKVIS